MCLAVCWLHGITACAVCVWCCVYSEWRLQRSRVMQLGWALPKILWVCYMLNFKLILVAAHSETPHRCHCSHGLWTHLHNPARTVEVACPYPLTQPCTHGWGSCALYFGVVSSSSFWGLLFNSIRASSKWINKYINNHQELWSSQGWKLLVYYFLSNVPRSLCVLWNINRKLGNKPFMLGSTACSVRCNNTGTGSLA